MTVEPSQLRSTPSAVIVRIRPQEAVDAGARPPSVSPHFGLDRWGGSDWEPVAKITGRPGEASVLLDAEDDTVVATDALLLPTEVRLDLPRLSPGDYRLTTRVIAGGPDSVSGTAQSRIVVTKSGSANAS
jgi:hypothetical protein